MPSLFPFDNAQIGDVALPAGVFLPGSASYTERGQDLATTTADGRIHYDRQAILRAATFALRGQHAELDNTSGAPVTVTLRRGATALVSFPGVVTAAYQARNHTTTVTIVGDSL